MSDYIETNALSPALIKLDLTRKSVKNSLLTRINLDINPRFSKKINLHRFWLFSNHNSCQRVLLANFTARFHLALPPCSFLTETSVDMLIYHLTYPFMLHRSKLSQAFPGQLLANHRDSLLMMLLLLNRYRKFNHREGRFVNIDKSTLREIQV